MLYGVNSVVILTRNPRIERYFTMRHIFTYFSLFICLNFMACSSARVLSQDMNGGILVISGSEDGMMKEAEKLMNAHCRSRGFSIVKRETVIVGQEQYSQTNYQDQAKTKAETDGEQVQETTGETVATPDTQSKAEKSVSAHQSQTNTRSVAEGEENTVSGVRDVTEHRMTYQCGQ